MRKIATMLAAATLAFATLAAAPPADASSYFPPADFDQCVTELTSQVQQVDDLEEAGLEKDATIRLRDSQVRSLQAQVLNANWLVRQKHRKILRLRREVHRLRVELRHAQQQ